MTERCEFCDGTEAECRELGECPGCECHDSPVEHQKWQREAMAYWGRYFGQDHGTKEERRRRLEAMDPRPPSAERMAEWQRLK